MADEPQYRDAVGKGEAEAMMASGQPQHKLKRSVLLWYRILRLTQHVNGAQYSRWQSLWLAWTLRKEPETLWELLKIQQRIELENASPAELEQWNEFVDAYHAEIERREKG